MASRASGKTSIVLSKTTNKLILKNITASIRYSSEWKKEAFERKFEALEESDRTITAAEALKQATEVVTQTQGASYASTFANKVGGNEAASANQVQGPTVERKKVPNKTVWAVSTSNNGNQKLSRPQLSVPGVSAISGLQVSGRSFLGPVSGNGAPALAESQRSMVHSGDRSTDIIHTSRDFQAGIIFSAATHQRDFSRDLDPRNINQSMTRLGIIHSKFRKFVVIARFATHVLALPIYTHGGRGLANKVHKNEFVSIRDVDSRQQAAMAETIHDIVWADRFPAFKNQALTSWFMMSNTTSIHLTAPYSHPMDLKCTISGWLEPSSIKYLQKLYGEATASAISAESLVKQSSDTYELTTVELSASLRTGSSYSRQGPTVSALRGRESWRPSNSYQPLR